MVAKVSDASGEAWVSTFNQQAEKIIGCSADELDKLKSQQVIHLYKPNSSQIQSYFLVSVRNCTSCTSMLA